jgi:hypothetical protein
MVDRYAPFVGDDDYEKMAEADDGAWVKYEDYQKLEAEVEVARLTALVQEHQTYQTKQGEK